MFRVRLLRHHGQRGTVQWICPECRIWLLSPGGQSWPAAFQLLVGQLTQGWKIKAANLGPLMDKAAALIQAFGRCDPSTALGTGPVRVPRAEILRVLVHTTEEAECQSDRIRVDRYARERKSFHSKQYR